MIDNHYVQIPHSLMQLENINGNHKILIAIILGYYRNNSFCFVSKKKLASSMGVTERTIYKLLKELKEIGFVKSIKTTPINGGNTVNILIPSNELIKTLNVDIVVNSKIYEARMIDYNGNNVELLNENYDSIFIVGSDS